MDERIVKIVQRYEKFNKQDQVRLLIEALRRISDLNLAAWAYELGIEKEVA